MPRRISTYIKDPFLRTVLISNIRIDSGKSPHNHQRSTIAPYPICCYHGAFAAKIIGPTQSKRLPVKTGARPGVRELSAGAVLIGCDKQ